MSGEMKSKYDYKKDMEFSVSKDIEIVESGFFSGWRWRRETDPGMQMRGQDFYLKKGDVTLSIDTKHERWNTGNLFIEDDCKITNVLRIKSPLFRRDSLCTHFLHFIWGDELINAYIMGKNSLRDWIRREGVNYPHMLIQNKNHVTTGWIIPIDVLLNDAIAQTWDDFCNAITKTIGEGVVSTFS